MTRTAPLSDRAHGGMDAIRWITRAPILLAGWYLMMAYPLDGTGRALIVSVAIGTLGALVIGITCYRAGRADS